MTSRITRIFFFLSLAQQLSHNWNVKTVMTVDAAKFNFQQTLVIPSCKDHGIRSGLSLEEDCVSHCYPNEMEVFDYSDSTEDPDYVVRKTICRCLAEGESPSAPKRKTSECTTLAQVWDKKKPVMKCLDDYGINSLATCQDYCKRIDPLGFGYEGSSGKSVCKCSAVHVCSDIETSGATNASSNAFVSTTLTLLVGCLAIYWS